MPSNVAQAELVKNIVIVGGGTAGWFAAAALARKFGLTPDNDRTITLIESPEIGTVGVGEATIPTIRTVLGFLRIDEQDFIAKTKATYKLAIKFQDWRQKGEAYWHPFGNFGPDIESTPLYQYWIKQRNLGQADSELMDLSIATALAKKNKFSERVEDRRSALSGLQYAYHFDAGLVAKYFREHSTPQGVERVEGKVVDVEQRDNGFIDAVVLDDGRKFSADFFIDCSGFRGLLINGALKSSFEDWTHLLPCDSAVAAPTELSGETTPYTLSTAQNAGWRWRIPLQHRVGNGYVYSSRFISDDDAKEEFLKSIDGPPIAEPRVLRFKGGMRREVWKANCLSLGLSSGFLEPLESTAIHLITAVFLEFLSHFPNKDCDPRVVADFNTLVGNNMEDIRDFLILHYCTTLREDTEFWRYCKNMEIPDSLRTRLDLYREQGRLFIEPSALFADLSWVSVMEGMEWRAMRYDPAVDFVKDESATQILKRVTDAVSGTVDRAKTHDDMLAKFKKMAGA